MLRFDSDSILITDNPVLIKAARRHYKKFKPSVNNVHATKTVRYFTSKQKCDLDVKTHNDDIGTIINESQEIQSLYWDAYNHTYDISYENEMYIDTCTLNVMSNIAIDMAKKEFDVNLQRELTVIRDKYLEKDVKGRKFKPYFFKHISKLKGYYDPNRTKYIKYRTSMDYLAETIDKYQRSRKNINHKDFLPFVDILKTNDFNQRNVNYDQIRKILNKIVIFKNKSRYLFKHSIFDMNSKYEYYCLNRKKIIDYIGELKINNNTMICMLRKFDTDEYKGVYKAVIKILFGYPNKDFYKVIKESKEEIPKLVYDNTNGNIEILGFLYKKCTKNG